MAASLPPDLRWVGFDLDDTLHHFGCASGRAARAVFAQIEMHEEIPALELASVYRQILPRAQAGHFTEPRGAREYRAERFAELLGRFGCNSQELLAELLDVYEENLAAALKLRPGARWALAAAKRSGLSVMVVSEGPHDAQRATIERLGLARYVDLLITSAAERIAKPEGLFRRALELAACAPEQLLFVGDSLERDVIPALDLGIAVAYVGEAEPPTRPGVSRIDLESLAGVLEGRLRTDGAQAG